MGFDSHLHNINYLFSEGFHLIKLIHSNFPLNTRARHHKCVKSIYSVLRIFISLDGKKGLINGMKIHNCFKICVSIIYVINLYLMEKLLVMTSHKSFSLLYTLLLPLVCISHFKEKNNKIPILVN